MKEGFEALAAHPIEPVAGSERSSARAKTHCGQAIELRKALDAVAESIGDTVAFGAAKAELVAGPDGALKDALIAWGEARKDMLEGIEAFELLGGQVSDSMSSVELLTELDVIIANKHQLAAWTRWREVRSKADAAGLSSLADHIEEGNLTEPASYIFRQAYARWWLPLALDASKPLKRFLHWEHEDTIKAFCELDTNAAAIAPDEVMRRINHIPPGAVDPSTRKTFVPENRNTQS